MWLQAWEGVRISEKGGSLEEVSGENLGLLLLWFSEFYSYIWALAKIVCLAIASQVKYFVWYTGIPQCIFCFLEK